MTDRGSLDAAQTDAAQIDAAQTDAAQIDEAHEVAGRIGLLGHGIYYLLLAALCGQLLARASADASPEGAIAAVASQPFGQVLLAGLTLAFAAYATIRWVRVVREDDWKDRGTNALRATVWTGLTLLAANAVITGATSSGGGSEQSMTQAVLDTPGGQALVFAIGLGLLGVALHQVRKGTDGGLTNELATLGLEQRRAARWLGRAGYLGRALAYGAVAGFVMHAAWTHDASQAAGGLDRALDEFQQRPYGQPLLLAVTLGFAAFGLFRLVEARYSQDVT